MKKLLCTSMAIITCALLLTGCSFFSKLGGTIKEEILVTSDSKEDTTEEVTTEDEGDEITVSNPEDDSTETEDNNDKTDDDKEISNPREDVAEDSSKEYQGSGKYCGFIDSISVEIEMDNGSYCSFFVYDENVKSALSALDEEDMPQITFTYKARDGQVNPEMISVIGG